MLFHLLLRYSKVTGDQPHTYTYINVQIPVVYYTERTHASDTVASYDKSRTFQFVLYDSYTEIGSNTKPN